ncbi:hypothetical protein FRB94_009403 [Tulasnella sp. JGI-2019a]|nr:hypothetical protein FRB93_006495 [Tulasnella sp. JGI-2019a]KAG9010923.1 hypothetical protein FRB94_009403 [Tulasnella sp. JGI-2019a]KAG9038443.1 hypothetical protein FRB95_001300 [Tulasnella sp. JGI-2019a]
MVRSLITLCITALCITSIASSSVTQPHRLSRRHANRRAIAARSNCAVSSSSNDTVAVDSTKGNSNSTSTTTKASYTKTTKASATSTASDANSSDSPDTGSSNSTSSADSGSSSNSTDSTGSGSGSGSVSSSGLFPTNGSFIAGWTLLEGASETNIKNHAPFTDSSFTLVSDMKALAHPVVSQNGKQAMHIHYNKGAYDLQTSPASIVGGFSFYSPGPASNTVDLVALKAREVSFGYNIMFSQGFQFNKGGKLPGLFGGTSWDVGATCSGGHHNADCFSTRMMFRPNGEGELYLYIPPASNRANLCGKTGTGQCAAPDAGITYGASVGTGNFMFKTGAWQAIREVIHLNTPGQKDGWAAVYVDGASDPAILIQNIVFGESAETYFRGQQMQSFFGGHETSWASPQAQDMWLTDFTLVATETF